jgi:hypothetical protein
VLRAESWRELLPRRRSTSRRSFSTSLFNSRNSRASVLPPRCAMESRAGGVKREPKPPEPPPKPPPKPEPPNPGRGPGPLPLSRCSSIRLRSCSHAAPGPRGASCLASGFLSPSFFGSGFLSPSFLASGFFSASRFFSPASRSALSFTRNSSRTSFLNLPSLSSALAAVVSVFDVSLATTFLSVDASSALAVNDHEPSARPTSGSSQPL